MKELVILRHAKSNNKYLVDDIDRPLSPAGIERIKKISKKMLIFFKNTDLNTSLINAEDIESKINMTKDVIKVINQNGI